MKTITVFTYGDSNDPSIWSNVPYLFVKILEKNFKVNRVNMQRRKDLFDILITILAKLFFYRTTYYYYRSKHFRNKVERYIKKMVKRYDDETDFYISMSFDFSPKRYTKKKVLLFSDWPIEYAIERRFNKKIDALEKIGIKNKRYILEEADYVVSMFADVKEYMEKELNRKIYYFGQLINSMYSLDGFDKKKNANNITFIGRIAYKECAYQLIKAFNMIDDEVKEKRDLKLHIVGMTENDIKCKKNDRIIFHGYLNKGLEKDRVMYYEILKNTLVIVNTSNKWAGMSSLLESMYYYCPIITSSYDEFVKTFGKNIDFGFYSKNDAKDIKKYITKILKMEENEYYKLCLNSHKNVSGFTYDDYVSKIINLINND